MDISRPVRDRIVVAALECMREDGVRSATTKTIARRAGVSEGSIYNHFANRSELIAEAFRYATHAIRDTASGLKDLVGEGEVEGNLVMLMEATIEFLRDISPIAGSVIGDAELRTWFVERQESPAPGGTLTPILGVIEVAEYLEREHVHGRLPVQESWVACASMIIGACQHYVYTELLSTSGIAGLLSADEEPVREYAQTIVRTLFDTSK